MNKLALQRSWCRCVGRVAGLALSCLALVCVARGVGAQQIDLRFVRQAGVEDYDFSWVYWFEMHGQRYLREAVAERGLPWDTPASRRWRDGAVVALRGALDDESGRVRGAAVLALGRMGDSGLVDVLLPEAAEQGAGAGGDAGDGQAVSLLLDRSAEVRLSAWAALGLLDTPRTRAALAAEPLAGAEERAVASQAMAIGLLGELSGAHERWLAARLEDASASAEVKRWCVWSLGRHAVGSVDGVYRALLADEPSTFIIGELLGDRGFVQRSGGSGLLIDVLGYHPDVRGWAGYRSLSGLPAGGLYGSTPRRLAMESRVAASLTLAELPLSESVAQRRELLGVLKPRLIGGNSAQAMDFPRGFDTIAYFMHSDASQADLDLLYDQMRGYMWMMADDPAVADSLEEGEGPEPEDLRSRQSDNEVRSYAALAAGLLIRRSTQGTELFEDRPITGRRAIEIERLQRRFGVRLMRAVADSNEEMSYRAACALALGLTGNDRYRAELVTELGRLRAGDEAVLGYGLLALSMLGEGRVAEPARRYVTRPGLVKGMDDRLGRRAALRALGVVGERGGEDLDEALVKSWGRDPWVSLSAAEASAWSGRYGAVPAMTEALGSESARWRWAAAVSLGIVFDRAFPSRLSPLVEGVNPTMSYRPKAQDAPKEDGGVVVEQPPDAPRLPRWPMPSLHALGDPFVFGPLLEAGYAPPEVEAPDELELPEVPGGFPGALGDEGAAGRSIRHDPAVFHRLWGSQQPGASCFMLWGVKTRATPRLLAPARSYGRSVSTLGLIPS